MKKVIASVLSVAMVAAFAAGCNKQPDQTATDTTKDGGDKPTESVVDPTDDSEPENSDKETMTLGSGSEHINLWSFTNEVPNMVNKYISLHPEFGEKYTVDVTIIATTNGAYQPALDAALAAGGQDAPDIYTAEAAFVLKYTQGSASQFAATYKDLGIDVDAKIKEAQIAPYTIDIGSRNGEVVGLGYQATGGAMIYRASIAKEVFGTDDPAEIEKIFGAGSQSWDKFWEAADKLKAAGYPIVSGDGDIWHSVENSASSGWVVDGQLNIAPEREAFLDMSKKLHDEGLSNLSSDWQPAWFADMNGTSEHNAFCFFGPAWLLNYSMHDNVGGNFADGEGTNGDWRVCAPPVGFYWGGTYLIANKDTDNKEGVAEFIEWVTLDSSDTGLQYFWANGTMVDGEVGTKDCVSSGTVMAKSNGEVEICGGQNIFPAFIKGNEYASGKCMTEYDEMINKYWRDAVNLYSNGECDRDAAIAQFTQNVNDNLSF